MIIILKKNATKEEIKAAENKFGIKVRKGKKGRGGLRSFFGKLKRGYDGLEYQKKVRGE